MDRGDIASTGTSPSKLPENLDISWTYEAGSAIETTVVVLEEKVVFADIDGGVHCIDATTGNRIWLQKIDSGFLAPPSLHPEFVVIGDFDGVVHALELATGKPLWTFTTEGEINAGITLVDDRALVSSQDGNLYALRLTNGELLWTYSTGDQVRCRPTVVENRTFLGGCDGQLHSVDVRDGKAAAEPVALDGPTGSTVAVTGEIAVLPTQTGSVLAFNWKSGQQLWTYSDPDRPQEYRNSAAVTPQHVIVTSKNRIVVDLDPNTGKPRWTTTLRKRADASPVIAGDDVWITATDGRIYRLGLDDGVERWQYELRGSLIAPPAVTATSLIVATDDGKVTCFSAPTQKTP